MNVLVASCWEGLVHATGFSILGIVVYLTLRRWSPAAGALAAVASLVVMVLVVILAFCPWPRWGADQALESIRLAIVSNSSPRDRDSALTAPVERTDGLVTKPSGSVENAADQTFPLEKPSMSFVFLQTLATQWGKPAAIGSRGAWSWTRWLALAMLGSMALGLVRLASGLWAIRRLRSRSEPLADPVLIDTVALLRAEMNCSYPVEVYTSSELATPATIGWSRTLILLPQDWQTWNDEERRAVLAHELAHVCRGDFVTGLIAQLSLALQFYHPLAHWLSARLRLEQELAADAWSAKISGGSQSYLTTLARMALRSDDRVLHWPARAFLPSRGTFVRRIEMLRDSKRVRHVGLSGPVRFLTVGLLATLGILIAGVRGPLAASPAQVQETTPEQTSGKRASNPANPAFELSLLPAETRMFVAAKPAALLRGPEWQPLLKMLGGSEKLGESFLLPLDEIEQLIVFWQGYPPTPAVPGSPTLIPPPSGVIVRAVKPREWKNVLSRLATATEPVQHAGQTYLRARKSPGQQADWSVYTPDDRMAVAAHEDVLRALIEDRKLPRDRPAWNDAWSQVAKGQINAVLDTRWLRRRIDQGQIKLGTIAPLLEKVRAYAVSINADRELQAEVVAMVGEPDDVKPVTETIQALLTMGRNTVGSLKEQAGNGGLTFREASDWALSTSSTLLDKARVETTGQTVRLRSSSPFDLAEAGRIMSSFASSAQTSASQARSINNLKQIGLAFHNYHNLKGHFPPPVLRGGKSGKVPYSWRVAILPYLAEEELYNSYNFEEPWDGPNNSKLLDRMPSVYGYPALVGASKRNTAYFVFNGARTLLGKGDKPVIADVADGMIHTILAVEAKREVPWTKPEDLPFDPALPLPQIGGFTQDGANVLFCDGHVGTIKHTIHPNVMKALITRDGGETIAPDAF